MKISTIFVIKYLVLIASVKVKCQEEKCKEPRPLGCPEIVCNLINSRESDFCKDIHCDGILPQDCPVGSVFEDHLTMCGCCGGCAKYIDEGEPCEVTASPPSLDVNCTNPYCPMLMNKCKPGLDCFYMGESSRVCTVIEAEIGQEDNCEFRRNQGLTGQLHWVPECDIDGSYAPKQCKGSRQDGTCFCVDPDGKRIFGREWWNKAENQTCGCSRHVYKLRKEGNIATIHCSADGNYEPLQCDMDSGLCYCVDPVTGNLNGAVVPEHQWRLLPCYSVNLTDGDPTGQYLRICESQWGAGQRIRIEASLHGLDVYAVADYECDYDGSFGPLRRDKSVSYCVPKNGNLQESRGHLQEMDKAPMDCQCFRDSLIYEEELKPFLKHCLPETGNYDIISISDPVKNEYSCVDKDGFFFGDPVPENYICCMTDDCGDKSQDIRDKCYDPINNRDGYKKCVRLPI